MLYNIYDEFKNRNIILNLMNCEIMYLLFEHITVGCVLFMLSGMKWKFCKISFSVYQLYL